MAPGSNQKRFSRSAGLRRLSSLRVASSAPPPASKSGSTNLGAGEGGPTSFTSYVLPDRSRAREFIRHVAKSSTSSSEFSLSVALSPPPPAYVSQSPPPPLPSQDLLSAHRMKAGSKTLSRRSLNISTTSTLRTFPHGEVFDQSTAPSPISSVKLSRSPDSSKLSENRPLSGIAGIGANGNARKARAALMAVDSEIFSTGPMPEPGLRKEVSMLSLSEAQQEHLQRQRHTTESHKALGVSPTPSLRHRTSCASLAPRSSTPTQGPGQGEPRSSSRVSMLGHGTTSLQHTISTPPPPAATVNQQDLGTSEAGSAAMLSSEALTTLASQIRRRSRSVNKIINSDVANGWQLLWTLATADNALLRRDSTDVEETDHPVEVTGTAAEDELPGAGRAKVAGPLQPKIVVPQPLSVNQSGFDSPQRPQSIKSQEQAGTPSRTAAIRPLRITRNTTSTSVPSSSSSRHSQSQGRTRPDRSTNTFSSSDSTRSTFLGSTMTSIGASSGSVYSVKSIASAKPQLTEASVPQRPPRSAKRVSMLWDPGAMRASSAVPALPALPSSPAPSNAESSKAAMTRRTESPAASPQVPQPPVFVQRPKSEAEPGPTAQEGENSASLDVQEESWATSFSNEVERRESLPELSELGGQEGTGTGASGAGADTDIRIYERQLQTVKPVEESHQCADPASKAQRAIVTEAAAENDVLLQNNEGPFADLEIVALTETESSTAASTSGDVPIITPSRKPSVRARRRRSRTWSANSTRSRQAAARTSHQQDAMDASTAPRTSVRSLVEILAEGESARMVADAQWEMLTSAKQVLPKFGSSDSVCAAHDTVEFGLFAGGANFRGADVPTAGHDRQQAMQAVEMWRRLAESYETGELDKMETVDTALTPAASVIMEDEESEALFPLVTDEASASQDIVTKTAAVPRTMELAASTDSDQLMVQPVAVHVSEPISVWVDKAPSDDLHASERDDDDSRSSTFDTPMPGGFTPRYTPATTPLPSVTLKGSHQSHQGNTETSFVQSAESSFGITRQGLGLVFEDGSTSPSTSTARRARDLTAETSTGTHVRHSDIARSIEDFEASNTVTDLASQAASDCFESADEGSEADWGSRRISQASQKGQVSSVVVLDAASGPQIEALAAQDESKSQMGAARRPVPRPQSARSSLRERKQMVQPLDERQERGDSSGIVTKSTLFGSSDSPFGESEHIRVRSVSELVQAAEQQPGLPLFMRETYAPRTMQHATHEASTQPIPQAPWIASPDLDGANSEPEATNMALLRLAKANRRRSTMARARNSIIVEETNGAEVLSARRASRRLSKLGLIDMSSSRAAPKTKSITARQKLTAFMNATPIMLVEPPSHTSWRSKLPGSTFQDLLSEWGPLEMHRQEVLWELCETERSFVQAICSVQKIFALPLRTPDGQWIKGVPCSVARLFDWLEDIFQLHCKIHSILQRARNQQGPMLISIAEELLRCIPKLEVHQPYLVRFESVTQGIEEMLRSENSVFGQFVKMQMQIPECTAVSRSMSFSSFLLKPVQRLMKYPLFFKQLAELTPSTHPDHHATQALLQSTDQVIRDMNDVKAREEDYRDLKQLQARIKGLPANFYLATRERRLLRQGQVTCVQLTPKEKAQIGLPVSLSETVPGLTHAPATASPLGFRAMSPSSFELRDGPSVSRKTTYESSESDHPQTSTAWGTSVGSCAMDWEAYVQEPAFGRPTSFKSGASTRSEVSTTPSVPVPSPRMPSLLNRKEKTKEKKTTFQAFIFSDLVLLATQDEAPLKSKPLRKSKANTSTAGRNGKGQGAASEASYELIERAGLSRVLKVTDHSGKCAERPHLLELELLPLKTDSSYAGSFDKRQVASGPTTLFLTFQPSAQDASTSTLKSPEQDTALWYRALERSFLWTLRTRKHSSIMMGSSKRESVMSMLSNGWRGALNQTAHADWPRRAEQVTDLVMAAARAGDAENLASLIQAGLPFPKSPSQQDLAVFAGEELRETHMKLYGRESELSGPAGEANNIPVVGFGILDEAEEEREERRWWALRLVEIRQAAEAEREIDAMVEQLRSDGPGNTNSPAASASSDPQLSRRPAAGVRRKVRQGMPVLRSEAAAPAIGHAFDSPEMRDF
ncbi:hypothetical protein V8E36_003314 [Tilletia maclaganii]